jgi:hypothetical protein
MRVADQWRVPLDIRRVHLIDGREYAWEPPVHRVVRRGAVYCEQRITAEGGFGEYAVERHLAAFFQMTFAAVDAVSE